MIPTISKLDSDWGSRVPGCLANLLLGVRLPAAAAAASDRKWGERVDKSRVASTRFQTGALLAEGDLGP